MTQQTRHDNHLSAVRLVRPPYYPYLTKGGIVTAAPVTDHDAGRNCHECQYFERCSEIVNAGGYALCERVIAIEVLPTRIIQQMEAAHV